MSPRFVRPYVKSSKNEARGGLRGGDPTLDPIHSGQEPSAARHACVAPRTCGVHPRAYVALMNRVRGLLAECGIVVAQGRRSGAEQWTSS